MHEPDPADTAFREEVRQVLAAKLTPELRQVGRRASGVFAPYPDGHPWFRILAERGWSVPSWPVEWGGCGWSVRQHDIFASELAAANAPALAGQGTRMVAPVVMAFGTPEQKERWLPGIRSGDDYWAQGYSEPGSGSDLASIRTRAVRTDAGWVINGRKVWTSGAHRTHYMIALVRTGTQGEVRQAGLSQLLVDMKTPGLTVRPILSQLGEHDFNEVTFDDVLVPHEHLIGVEGEGWSQVSGELAFERSGPERYLSSSQLLLEMIDAAPTDDQRHAVALGRIAASYATLRQMSLGVSGMLARGENPAVAAALVQDQGALVEQAMPDIAHDLYGGLAPPGSTLADVMSYTTRAVPSFSLRGGTREILRGIIAKGLGLR